VISLSTKCNKNDSYQENGWPFLNQNSKHGFLMGKWVTISEQNSIIGFLMGKWVTISEPSISWYLNSKHISQVYYCKLQELIFCLEKTYVFIQFRSWIWHISCNTIAYVFLGLRYFALFCVKRPCWQGSGRYFALFFWFFLPWKEAWLAKNLCRPLQNRDLHLDLLQFGFNKPFHVA
jgi:hypothetical protein